MGTRAGVSGLAHGEGVESPQRKIWLDAYDIDLYEVSLGEYLAWVLNKPRALPPDLAQAERLHEISEYTGIITGPEAPSANRLAQWPAFGVTWHEAEAFCRAKGRRLPTEAEWEKAARGPSGSTFPWGKASPNARRAVYGRTYATAIPQVDVIDSFPNGRSRYGLFHMAGNVAEWVSDWADPAAYRTMPERNPRGPAAGQQKVVRGGSWQSQREMLRAASRYAMPPGRRDATTGFRCARSRR